MRTWRAAAGGSVALVIGLAVLLLGTTIVVGADYLWAVALGREIVRTGGVPDGLPFAAAATSGWPNVPVVGELLVAVVDRFGPVGAGGLQLLVGVLSWLLISSAAGTRGGGNGASAAVVALVVAGALPAWGVVRLQVLSLVPFALVLWLLHRQHAEPSRAIWLLPVIVAAWGNLHGAVLLGVCVIGTYLLGSRLRVDPWTAIGVGTACLAALFANPGLGRTLHYYIGVLTNEAARSRSHLWAPPSLSNPLDVLLLLVAAVLLALALSARPAVWEWLAIVGLALATAGAARNGLWLLLMLSAPAAARISTVWARGRGGPEVNAPIGPMRREVVGLAAAVVGGILLLGREAAIAPSNPAVVEHVVAVSVGRVVLAPEPLVESLVLAGVRVWACDPIDAFAPGDQRSYLAFLSGSGDWGSAAAGSQVIVLPIGHQSTPGVPAEFRSVSAPAGWAIWVRG